ncbi:MAG: type II toxin-antitoxin system HicA family toxin [Longimicrobiaceae bacterium]
MCFPRISGVSCAWPGNANCTLFAFTLSTCFHLHVEQHQRTLAAIFEDPVRTNILWRDIVAMLVHAGAEVRNGAGSRVRVTLLGKRVTLHRPHRRKEASSYTVRDLRAFLLLTGVVP